MLRQGGNKNMLSRKARAVQLVLCVLAAFAAAKLAQGQDLQTGRVAATNARGL